MVATPSPNYSDKQLLALDATFVNRVRQSLLTACSSIHNEGWAVAFHRERETYAAGAMNQPEIYKVLFANVVACDANIIGDATVGGTVPLTSGNVAAQAALVTDPHIDTAISANFNSFFRTPSS
jgi:hypothetical protein